ncbi:hypothetical protein PHET_10192 [Paragonimus heterotremus]|uniref:Ig-like domain-containing protein n=1 Tax=Paragonimus heterotremus TaxID=100268 RepID=A0A8J4WEC2_9TREM|nr:hypothetical protein PHET_10192 [Paragonimus heterotremus]
MIRSYSQTFSFKCYEKAYSQVSLGCILTVPLFFLITAPPILPLFSKDRRVLEGDRLSLFCEVTGYPKPSQVHWFFAHIQPDMMEDKSALAEARDRLEELVLNANVSKFITNSVMNDQLLFIELPSEYNGLYKCKVDGDDGGDETLILVNVKDRWAALWPFVGIVIEVTVLVTAILLYERHQMRSKPTKTDVVTGQVTTDATSPNIKRTGAAQVQQNNTTVPVITPDPNADVNVEGNRTTGVEFGDAKHDELRQRGASRC